MIVVTGGAGFIGSCLLSQLNSLGFTNCIVVDHFDGEDDVKQKNLEGKNFEQYYDKSEFLEKVLANDLSWSPTVVFHIGACSSTVLQDEKYFEVNNFEYSCHMLNWAMKHNARFIYASSAATYGDGEQGYKDDPLLIPKLKPLNFYGQSKQKFDQWILDNGLYDKVVGLKFFNVFGPNEYHKGEMRSVVAKQYQAVVDEGIMRLFKSYREDFKDGEQRRDFIYVKDVVDIILFFSDNSQVNGIFNVGTGKACTWNDLAHAVFAAVGKEPHIEYVDMPDILKLRYQYFTEADITFLRSVGYSKEFTSFEDSVKEYSTYLSNQSCM